VCSVRLIKVKKAKNGLLNLGILKNVFPGFSVVLIQLRSHFFQNVAPFDILRFSHHFFHFAADSVTLSLTKMAIFPTL